MDEEDLKAELTCPICMDLFREPRRLPCGHVYCRVCLQDMLTRKYLNTRASERILSCPECRQKYDLTFQEAGVDVFTRDFKLFRLVELFEKKFSRGREDGEGDGGAEAGADEQTAVKSVCASETERESSPQTSAEASASCSQPSASRSSVTQEQQEASLLSVGSSAASLTDDSWIYVSPESHHRLNRSSLTPALRASRHHHQRADDSWLLPSGESDHGGFPVDGGADVRGSAGVDVNYRTLSVGEGNPAVDISGRYDNTGPETFQRFAVDEPSVQVVRLPSNPRPRVTSPSSDSSSESESSDERGDEGSEDRSGEEVSGSGSDGGSQSRNRRSRLSRFFRSLVMSDTDSYDEEEQVYNGRCPSSVQQPQSFPAHAADYMAHGEPVMASAPHGMSERGSDMSAVSAVPGAAYYENGAVLSLPPSAEGHSRPAAPCPGAGGAMADRDKNPHCDSNHNSLVEMGRGRRSAAARAVPTAAAGIGQGVAVGGVGRALPAQRGRMAIEVSDDSEDDYEPQTSMLRPRRKPRSRLKKFFTSLLSLSSSDDDDEEVEGQVTHSSTPTPDRH